MNARAVGSGLDAVKDAISFYMDLRSQKVQDRRNQEADSRAKRQLDLLEEQHNQQQADRTDDNERAAAQFAMTNYGGAPLDQAGADRFKRLGYGAAVEQDMTLPSSNPAMPTGMPGMGAGGNLNGGGMPEGMSSPMSTIERYSPSAPTGGQHIRMPESEKSRIAYYNTLAAGQRNDANIGARASEGDKNRAVRQAAIRASMNNAQTAAAIAKYGIDVRDMTQRAVLEERLINDENIWADRDIDNQNAGGVTGAILRSMQNSLMPPVRRLPGRPLQGGGVPYYQPPPAGAPAAGEGSRYTVER